MYMKVKRLLGVTLLEIMLVLAVAAMIIVMSVRYYQSASTSSKVNTALTDLTGVIASVDSFLSAGGALADVDCDDTACTKLAPYLTGGKLPSNPWGTGAKVKAGTGNYTVTFIMIPNTDCARMIQASKRNSKISGTEPTKTTGNADCAVTVAP